jgi:hypothetical protein
LAPRTEDAFSKGKIARVYLPDQTALRRAAGLCRELSPRSLDELLAVLFAAHERFGALERKLGLALVALNTLGIDLGLPPRDLAPAEDED